MIAFFRSASFKRVYEGESFVLLVCMIAVPSYLPDVAITGSEPTNVGVITTWSPSTK